MRHWLAAAILGLLAFGPAAQAQTNPAAQAQTNPTAQAQTNPTAQAQTKLRIVHTSSSLITPGFVADEQGFFAAHGLAVSFTPIPINSQLPAALMSGSAEIAYLTLSSLVQATDGGIELVAIAGTGAAYPGGTNEAMVARPGSGIAQPADYIGKRVGVPGIGVVMDIMFRNWLLRANVDPERVDALRGGSVDAVIANDPQLYRMVRSGIGVEAGRFMDALPGDMPLIVYAVTKEYAASHRDVIAAFQAAHKEGIAWMMANQDAARAIMARRLKLDPALVKDMEFPRFMPDITPASVQIMVNMLREQKQLQHPDIDPASMVYR